MPKTNEFNFQDKLIPVMTVALIAAAFFLGNLWGKVQIYEGGSTPSRAAAGTPTDGSGDAAGALPAPAPEGPLSEELWNEIITDPVYAFGEESASVTMVEFTDYQCPFCKRHFDETHSQVLSDYVNSGQVRYLFRDLPLSFHANAKPAALAARCAGDQGKYLEMHDKLFEMQDNWSNGSADEAFKGYASDLGLNTGTFDTCYDNGTYNEAIDAELALAAKVGASGTPTFFVNGTKIVGAQPFSAFQAAIDAAL